MNDFVLFSDTSQAYPMHLLNFWRLEWAENSLTTQCNQNPKALDVNYWSIMCHGIFLCWDVTFY